MTWRVIAPTFAVDQVPTLRRGQFITQHHRGYRGRLVRSVVNDRGRTVPEYASCVHVHRKYAAARTCAEQEARRRNRQEAPR